MKILISSFTAALLLISCANHKFQEELIAPFQKKADIKIENPEYEMTNVAITDLAKKFDGFVKSSSVDFAAANHKSAVFTLNIPFTFFNNFLASFHEQFKSDIKSEAISNEEALARVYYADVKKLQKTREVQEDLMENYTHIGNNDQKIILKYEIDKLSAELEELQQRRLSLLESLNYSTVTITWSAPALASCPHEEKSDSPHRFFNFPPTKGGVIPGMPDLEFLDDHSGKKHCDEIGETREIILDKCGQEVDFHLGEPVKITMDGLDMNNTDIITKIDYENNNITLKVAPYGKGEINLNKKCEIINVGLGPLPKIIPGSDISLSQIIITPRVDDDCNLIGYELRAGTVESGCADGRPNLKRLKKCTTFKKFLPKENKTNYRNNAMPRHKSKVRTKISSLPPPPPIE
ncbi:MAG: DUF4349 domain-containing protein [Candidatus Kapabacteria bacterium]|nr:DUF4349 domain-containing protein [Candidatus Kapabacteria bacterium]